MPNGMLFSLDDIPKEDIKAVMKELSTTCTACRLSLLHPFNRGLLYRGNPMAKIAVLAEAPGDRETELGQPLVGRSGKEWDRWAKSIDLDTKTQVFHTNVIQCQPPKAESEGKMQQVAPDKDEITACFIPRCLRVLKAMPNLECVITLGWVAAKALLGGEPKTRSHEGQWFESNTLPGIAIFCMVHPSFVIRDPTPDKEARVMECMKSFRREFINSDKCVKLAQQVKEKRDAAGY